MLTGQAECLCVCLLRQYDRWSRNCWERDAARVDSGYVLLLTDGGRSLRGTVAFVATLIALHVVMFFILGLARYRSYADKR
jgi:hypothetical protein